jgi:phytoene dehydrogenase-like protein
VSHEYWITSTAFHVDEDPNVYISSLKLRFPSEAKGIDQFFSIFRKCYEELCRYATLFGGVPRAPRNSDEMRKFRERCPTLAEFIGVSYVEMRDSLLRDLELRRIVSVLSIYITDDVCNLSFANMVPLFGYYFRGGHYPRGGSQALANVLAKGIKEMGGQIRLRAPVAHINVLDGCAIGLILRDGTELRADAVISNADTAQTFGSLVDARYLPKRLATAASAFQPSNSAFMVFLGLKVEPQLASSTIIMEENTGVIISHPPFAEDRAPKGYTSVTLTGLVPANEAEIWRGKPPLYNRMKRDAGDRLIALASRRIPDIANQIVYREEGSPATLQRYTWATGAAAYGSTPRTRWPNHETPIKGLYVVGASTGLGPGIEAVMVGGASLAELIGSRTTVCSA